MNIGCSSFMRLGRRRCGEKGPAAVVISRQQRDPGALRRLLETLAFGLVEVEKSATAFAVRGKQYPEGSYVIRLQQPYGGFAKTLLEKQTYPDLRDSAGRPIAPYDVTAHSLPLLMGIDVRATYSRMHYEKLLIEEKAELSYYGKVTRVAVYKSHAPSIDEGWTRWGA